MDYTITNFERSRLYRELTWRRFEKKLRPFLAIALVGWMAWMILMMVGTAESASNIVYYLN